MHLCLNASSPTANTSSINSMSGSTLTAQEKASLAYIPDEKFFSLTSWNLSSPAKLIIAGSLTDILLLSIPMSAPKMNSFPAVTGDALVSLHESRGLMALIGAIVAASAALLSLLTTDSAEPLLLTLMAVLSMLGVFFVVLHCHFKLALGPM